MNQQVNVNLNEMETVKCDECGCMFFQDAMMLKRIPALMSQNGQEQEYAVQIMMCLGCGKPKLPAGLGTIEEKQPEEESSIITTTH